MGGLCNEGHEFLRLCKKRNKGATLHLLDVLVTQHAKRTAKRVRRGLFGQSIVDFSTETWSGIQLKESACSTASQHVRKPAKKTPRLLRSFAQVRVVEEKEKQSLRHGKTHLLPGMALYESQDVESQDVDMDVGIAGTAQEQTSSLSFSTAAAHNQKLSQTSDGESDGSGSEESCS